jgi:hypothetical protein
MKISITSIRRPTVLVLFGLIALSLVALPSLVEAQDQKGGAVFKIPDGYMQMQMPEFRGVMMLDPKRPAGMFVTYPNDNETTETLRQRILALVAPMFIHDEKLKATTAITWDTKSLPSHPDDGDGKALVKLYSGATNEMQVAIYERTTGVRPFLYGYFAMRHKSGKSDDGKFLDEQGQGVKAFEKLWKSFPK